MHTKKTLWLSCVMSQVTIKGDLLNDISNTIVFLAIKDPGPTPSLPFAIDTSGNAMTIYATEIVQAKHTYEHEAYFTDQGCEEGIKALIKNTVPKQVLEKLYDNKISFANATALKMMKHLNSNCTVTNIYDVGELMTEYQQPINFDGDETLKMYFAQCKCFSKLLKQHGIHPNKPIDILQCKKQHHSHDAFDNAIIELEMKTSRN